MGVGPWWAVGLLFLLFPSARSFPCERRRKFPPCIGCNATTRAEVLQRCGKSRYIGVHPSINSPNAEVDVYRDRFWITPTGRLGNLIPAYLTAVGLAQLGGMGAVIIPLEFEGIRFDFSIPNPEPANPSDRFLNLNELDFLCQRCPLTIPYPHECPGLWLATNMREIMHKMFAEKIKEAPRKEVLIQFRCSDSHEQPYMGLLPFDYYARALRGRVTNASTLSIMPDPKVISLDCCHAQLHVLQAALMFHYRCAVEILHPAALAYDFALFINAKVFVAGPSTLGLFAAIATTGRAFVPDAPLLVKGTKPCLDGVQWLPTLRTVFPCKFRAWDWFAKGHDFRKLRQHLKAVFGSAWFRPQLFGAPLSPG